MSNLTVYTQEEFDEDVVNWAFGSDCIILHGDEFYLNTTLLTKELRGYSNSNKPRLILHGSEPLFGDDKQFIWLSEYKVKNVILTSDEKINLIINNQCEMSSIDVDENKITIINTDNITTDIDDESLGVDVFSQEELDDTIANDVGVVNLYGDIFTIPSSSAGFTFIGKNEHTILLLKGDDDCLSARMSNDEFVDVYQFDSYFITCKNVIISCDRKIELVFSTIEIFESWENVTYDHECVDIVIREDEYSEFNIRSDHEIKSDMDFLRKYKVKFTGYEDDSCTYENNSNKLSYEDACATYYKTKLKVGAIITAKLKGGIYRYGIFAGKNRIISICPNTDLVIIMDHDTFLSGVGFFNGSAVYRMGYLGDDSRTMKESYEYALSLLGEEYSDDKDFVMDCRFSPNADVVISRIDDDAKQFLNDL